MGERQYPHGIAAAGEGYERGTYLDLTVWMEQGFTPGKVFKIAYYTREPEAIVSVLTDAGSYWFNNWDFSQGGEPSKWDEIERLSIPDARDAHAIMRRYAIDHWGVRQINGDVIE